MLSAAAGITWWNFYFRLYPGTIRAPQVIDFLSHLLRHLPGKLLVSGTACRPIERAWSANLSAPSGAGSPSSACRVTRRNSIRWNTSGATGKIMNCPISVHTISASSVIRRAARYAACAAAPVWSARPGIKQNCHYDMQDSIAQQNARFGLSPLHEPRKNFKLTRYFLFADAGYVRVIFKTWRETI